MKKIEIMILFICIIINIYLHAEKYAVLIIGDEATGIEEGIRTLDNQGNESLFFVPFGEDDERWSYPMICFWTDTVILYNELINEGYQAENIFVLFGRGYDFELYTLPPQYDPEPNITDYPARVEDVENIFTLMRDGNSEENIPALTDSDFLFVWTFGHGGFEDLDDDEVWDPGEEVFLCLMDDEFDNGTYVPIMASGFSFQLNQISFHKRVIWMQQCHAGGFIEFLEVDGNQEIIDNNIIMTACDISEEARVADDIDIDGNYIEHYEKECIDYCY